MEIDKKLVKRQLFIDLTLILLIGIVTGFLIGEYKTCPEGRYSYEYGCLKWRKVELILLFMD